MIPRSPRASEGENPKRTDIALSTRAPYQRPCTSQIRVRVQVRVQQLQHSALMTKFEFPSLSHQRKGTSQRTFSLRTGVGMLVYSVHTCLKNLVFHGPDYRGPCKDTGRDPLCYRLFHIYKKGLILPIFTPLMLWSTLPPSFFLSTSS